MVGRKVGFNDEPFDKLGFIVGNTVGSKLVGLNVGYCVGIVLGAKLVGLFPILFSDLEVESYKQSLKLLSLYNNNGHE